VRTRALVTGAAGFAGSHLTDLLLEREREVWGLVPAGERLDNLAEALGGPAASGFHRLDGDLLDAERLAEAMEEFRPDEVYHLAAQASVRQSLADAAATFRVNVLGTETLLEAIRRGPARPRVLVVSSAEAYGESAREEVCLQEAQPLLPVSPYGSSKAAAEQVAARYGREHGLDVRVVRPFPHTGPRQSPQFVCPDLARQIQEIRLGRRPPRLEVGNLEVRRDLSDVRDTVAAYMAAVSRGASGETYNVCSGRAPRLGEVLDTLIALAGVRVEVAVRAERLRPQDLPTLCGSPAKLAARTGWRAERPLEATLQALLDYWQARCAPLAGG
jgi:GDP-4-dehydro-6-deoxy-D-mannose reductase